MNAVSLIVEHLTDGDLGLPWTASKPGNHNTDGVMITRLNPAGLRVQVLAVRYQGTAASMCAEPTAQELIRRVASHTKLVTAVRQLKAYLAVAAGDGAYDEELKAVDRLLAEIG